MFSIIIDPCCFHGVAAAMARVASVCGDCFWYNGTSGSVMDSGYGMEACQGMVMDLK